jgi:hypothetical protein
MEKCCVVFWGREGHLNTRNKVLQCKDKLITEMFDSIEAFRVTLQLWEDQSEEMFLCLKASCRKQ